MMLGVAWAVVGYVVCELTSRGKLATTVITAIAGGLGLGAGALKHSGVTAPRLFQVGVWFEIAIGVVVLAVLFWRLIGHRGSLSRVYFIASNRQVMADMDEQTGGPLTTYGRSAHSRKRRMR